MTRMRTPSWCALLKFAHGLLVSVHLEAYFIPKGVAVFHLPGTIAEIYTGMKFSLRYRNFGKLAPVWLVPVWHFLLVSYKRIRSYKRELEWTRPRIVWTPPDTVSTFTKIEKCYQIKNGLQSTIDNTSYFSGQALQFVLWLFNLYFLTSDGVSCCSFRGIKFFMPSTPVLWDWQKWA